MMTDEQAVLILETAKENGFYDHAIPENQVQRTAEAESIVEEAVEAQRKGANNSVIQSILHIARDEEVVTEPSSVEAHYPKRIQAQARIKKEKLPIPDEIDESPTMPRDLTQEGDRSIRRLSSEFNACLIRTNWLVAIEEADELMSRHLAEYYFGRAMKKLRATDESKIIPVLEAEAREDEEYKLWKEREMDHKVELKLLKALRDNYQGNCERLSREYTMREGERNVT